jgi:hypothetical protein
MPGGFGRGAHRAAIPITGRWPLASLPEYLGQEELAKLMSAFEQVEPQRQRDYAIVRCLVDPFA